MRILVIGNSKSAEILTNFLSENKDLLVFTTKEGTDGNFIDINPKDVEELKEFALANEINLSIAADIFLSDIDYFQCLVKIILPCLLLIMMLQKLLL